MLGELDDGATKQEQVIEAIPIKCTNDGVAHIRERFVVPVDVLKQNKLDEVDVDHSDSKETDSLPNKKKKTGRNSNRPRLKREAPGKKLCRNYWSLRPGEIPGPEKCPFNNCVFSHDVQTFLDNKPEDLGDKCHNFDSLGFCPYGVICRFGSEHIKDNGSVCNEEKYDEYQAHPPTRNLLTKEVQWNLRKRKYVFKSEAKESSVPDQNGSRSSPKVNSDNLTASSNDVTTDNIPKETINMSVSEEDYIRIHSREKKKIDWRDKLYLAPLTTLGNLPFRRVCKRLGADVTCGEMAVATGILQGSASEWALLKRHKSEDLFGVQLCGGNTHVLTKCAELLENEIDMDFVDLNMGCPIDLIFQQGAGSALMRRINAVSNIVAGMSRYLSCPVTLKMRTGVYKDSPVAQTFIEKAKLWDVSLITVHGRSKEQRYLKSADWDYIRRCTEIADPMPIFGNGDVLTYHDYERCKRESKVAGIMLARGALIKPWLFTEIKEQRGWDISSGERLDILREFVNNGLEHWGSDTEGVEKTRRFLLEWLSFLYRYIPVGVLEQPQRINQRPPVYMGRNDLETLMASKNDKDWVKISEMLLGPVPSDFEFLPKHKANSWS